MKTDVPLRLSADQIERLSSPYISEGLRQDAWRIDAVEIEGDRLSARISMTSTYVSRTDPGGFHLTIFATMEFLSQLQIIYMHVWAGLAEKTREVWLLDAHSRCLRTIRNPVDIRVEMTLKRMRSRDGKLHATALFEVTDEAGGLFEVTMTMLMA